MHIVVYFNLWNIYFSVTKDNMKIFFLFTLHGYNILMFSNNNILLMQTNISPSYLTGQLIAENNNANKGIYII